MYRLFDRVVELRIGGTHITGLDIAFEIEKDLSPEPNPCHVEIYNLSQKNREILSKSEKRTPVLLKAGYKGHVSVIFQGDMLTCRHIKEGPTWKTVLANGDGATAIQTSRIKKSFAKGTPVIKVIEEIAKQLNLPSGNAFNTLSQIKALMEKLPRGFSVCGNAMEELNQILDSYGYSASVQNNSLQLLKQDEPLAGRVISLNHDSGLKGTPQMGSDKTIHLQAVLLPELVPGSKVHIESAVFSGFATVQAVRFEGANFGDGWSSETTCKVS